MINRLAEGIQVRKETWGLLFYSSTNHKIHFVKSGDLLHPEYFDGTQTLKDIVVDVSTRTGSSQLTVRPSLEKSFKHLVDVGLIVREI